MKMAVIIHPDSTELVIDSRFVAYELGIQHKSFMRTLRNQAEMLESETEKLRFETAPSKPFVGSKRITFCYLTEEQCLFLLSCFKNTDQGMRGKVATMKAFASANILLESMIHPIKPQYYPLKAANQCQSQKQISK